MKLTVASVLAAVVMASSTEAEIEGIISDNTRINANFDRDDPNHHFFGERRPASPMHPKLPDINMVVDEFDPRDTLFD